MPADEPTALSVVVTFLSVEGAREPDSALRRRGLDTGRLSEHGCPDGTAL
jgi:hypothetical protein